MKDIMEQIDGLISLFNVESMIRYSKDAMKGNANFLKGDETNKHFK